MRAIKNKLEAFGSSNQHVRLMTSNELDKCLREALYSETVGCSDSILFDISQATYHDAFFDRIMKAAWSCVGSRASKIRRIQKGLNLLNYLAINGSERCISDIIGHIDVLHSLPKLKFGKNNTELSMLVIEKASQLSALVLDSKTLQDKRKYAASIRDRFVSVGSTNGFMETDVLHKPVFVLDKTKNIPQEMNGPNGMHLGFGGLHSRTASRLAMNQMIMKHTGRKFLSRLFRNSLKVSDNPHNMGLFGNQQGSFADYQVTGANLGYGMGGYGDMSTGVNRFGTPNHSSNLNFGGSAYANPSNNFVSGSFTGRNSYNGLVGSNVSNFSTHEDEFNAFPVVNNANDSYYKHSFAGARSSKAHKGSAKLGANRASAARSGARGQSHNGSKSDDSSFKYHTSTSSESSYSSSTSSSSDSDSSYSSRPLRTHHRHNGRYEGRGHGADHRGRSSKSTRHRGGYNRRHSYSESSGSSGYSRSDSEYESSDHYEHNERHYQGHQQHYGHYNNSSYSGYSAPPPGAPGHYYDGRYYSPEGPRHLHAPEERPDFDHGPHGRDYSGHRYSSTQRFSGNGYSTAGRGYAPVGSAAPRPHRNYHQHSDDYQDHQGYVIPAGPGAVDSKYPQSGHDRRHNGGKYAHEADYPNGSKYSRHSKYPNDNYDKYTGDYENHPSDRYNTNDKYDNHPVDKYTTDRYDPDDKYTTDRYDPDDKYSSDKYDKPYPDRFFAKPSIRDTYVATGSVAPGYSRHQNPFTRS